MTPLHHLSPRPIRDLRIRVNHPGDGRDVAPGVVEGIVVHVDRFGSGVIDSAEIRTDDRREIHVPGGTPAEVVARIEDPAHLDYADEVRRVEGVMGVRDV